MKLYHLLIPFASKYIILLYNLATKDAKKILIKKSDDKYLRRIEYDDDTLKGLVHIIEEYNDPDVKYVHKFDYNNQISKQRIYPLDSYLLKIIIFKYYKNFKLEEDDNS